MQIKRVFVPVVAAIAIAASTSFAAADVAPPGEAFTTLMAEYDADERGWPERYAAFEPRFVELADTNRGTPDEVRIRLFMLGSTWWQRDAGTMHESSTAIVDDLLKRHAESELLGEIIDVKYVLDKETRERVFAAMLKSSHGNVQASGHLGLAGTARTDEERGHLLVIVRDHADVPYGYGTYGAIANARLNPHDQASLAVGMPAPNIEGVDHLLQPMSLSRYKGRVVLLDFWGDW